jgi:UDP-3-O-[3-hydroxymyristoyl] N-acetylglucosamine deacetylase
MQKTLKREVFISGAGLFTGAQVAICLKPAPAGYGIVFQRIDLPNKPLIPAAIENVSDILRCTRLKTGNASIITVEHLLSACSAYEIDNIHIDVEGPEIPAVDGSSKPFIDLIEAAGIDEQDAPKKINTLSQPIFWSENEIHLIALPSFERRVSFTLHYPQSVLLRSQFFSLSIDPDSYKTEIAPCRTFSLYEEIAPLIEKGLIKGGGLENAVVIREDKILNPGGVRFSDEMVRHKILDLIGDLSLLGNGLKAHIIAIRSGHASNIAFAKTLHKVLQPDRSSSKIKIQVGRESHG